MTMIRRRRCCLPTMSMAVVCLLAAVMMMSSMGSSYGQESDIYNDEEGYGYGNDNEDMYAGQDYGGDSYQDYNNNNAADSYYSQQQTQDLQQQEQQDNLYADYAARQEMKELGGGGGGYSLGTVILGGGISYILGANIHGRLAVKKMRTKFQKEQKALYAQYYNDVYKLTEQNAQLSTVIEKLYDQLETTQKSHELEAVQRDYDEFKQPDLDGDDRISRTEFDMYVRNYLANYPGMDAADYPKFADFDHDGDGYVSFKEYASQMAIQTQEAERKQSVSEETERKKKLAAQQALKSLYK